MTVALRRLLTHLPQLPAWTVRRLSSWRRAQHDADQYFIGEFRADYGPIPHEQLADAHPEVAELLERSTVVSRKREL